MYGCSKPVVLRKKKDEIFEFVTYTYTHDVMIGDDFNVEVSQEIQDLETREFELC